MARSHNEIEVLTKRIKRDIKNYFAMAESAREFRPGRTRISLSEPSFDSEEVCEALDSLLTTKVTMGEKVAQFEELFAHYIGMKYGIMVNSGSSANLLALSILTNPAVHYRMPAGSEVVTPRSLGQRRSFPLLVLAQFLLS